MKFLLFGDDELVQQVTGALVKMKHEHLLTTEDSGSAVRVKVYKQGVLLNCDVEHRDAGKMVDSAIADVDKLDGWNLVMIDKWAHAVARGLMLAHRYGPPEPEPAPPPPVITVASPSVNMYVPSRPLWVIAVLLALLILVLAVKGHAQAPAPITPIGINLTQGATTYKAKRNFTFTGSVTCAGTTMVTCNFTGGSPPAFQVNGVATTNQSIINFINGTSITASNPAAGNVRFDFSGVLPANEAGAANNFLTAYNNTTGAWTKARPACATLSDGGTLCASSAALAATIAAVSHKFLTAYDATSGAFTSAQPAASDISGLAASATTDTTVATNITSGTLPSAQLPNPAASAKGGVQSKDCTGTGHVLSINTDSTVTCSADGGGSTLNAFGGIYPPQTANSGIAAANLIYCAGFMLPYSTTVGKITIRVLTADNSGNLYDWGILDSTGTMKLHIGATAGSALPSPTGTGAKDIAISGGGTVTLSPGRYYFCQTGNATTLRLDIGTNGGYTSFYSWQTTGVASSGGALASITAPADTWTTLTSLPWFWVHN